MPSHDNFGFVKEKNLDLYTMLFEIEENAEMDPEHAGNQIRMANECFFIGFVREQLSQGSDCAEKLDRFNVWNEARFRQDHNEKDEYKQVKLEDFDLYSSLNAICNVFSEDEPFKDISRLLLEKTDYPSHDGTLIGSRTVTLKKKRAPFHRFFRELGNNASHYVPRDASTKGRRPYPALVYENVVRYLSQMHKILKIAYKAENVSDFQENRMSLRDKSRIKYQKIYRNHFNDGFIYQEEDPNREISSELLGAIRQKEMKKEWNDLSGVYWEYKEYLSKEYFSPRILLKGNRKSGRTAHLLRFWKDSLDDEERIVLYLSGGRLSTGGVLETIITEYFENEPSLRQLKKNKDPETRRGWLKEHLKGRSGKRKLILLFDDFDRMPDNFRGEFSAAVLNDGVLEAMTVIAVSGREEEWWKNATRVEVTNLKDEQVRNYLLRHGISFDTGRHVEGYLRSPWFLRLFAQHPDSTSLTNLINKGQRLRISQMELGDKEKDVMFFSEQNVLPMLAGLDNRRVVKKKLPEVLECLQFVDCMDETIKEVYESCKEDPDELFKAFFEEPVLIRMDILRVERRRMSEQYIWKNESLSDYYMAVGLWQRMCLEDYIEEAKKELGRLADRIFAYHYNRAESTGLSMQRCFDRISFFLELAENEKTEGVAEFLQAEEPALLFRLYAGMAAVYEKRGDDAERFACARKAIEVYQSSDKAEFEGNSEQVATAAYFIIKSLKKNPDYFEKAEEAHDILVHLKSKEKDQRIRAKILADIGAYFQRMGDYDAAEESYQEGIRLREQYLKEIEDRDKGNNKEKNRKRPQAVESVRRGYVQLATNAYYRKDYEEAVLYHGKAIETGQMCQCPATYESYSRRVGCRIGLLEQGGWTVEKAVKLLEELKEGSRLMMEWNGVNLSEVSSIYEKAQTILTKVVDYEKTADHASATEQEKQSLQSDLAKISSATDEICKLYQNAFWSKDDQLIVLLKSLKDLLKCADETGQGTED